MKKLIALLVSAVLGLALTATAMANSYSPSASEIDSFYQVTPGTLTGGPDASGYFTVSLAGSGFADVQIGRDATIEGPGSAYYSGSWANLTGYDTYQMGFKNTSATDWFMANIYLNTGWTDIGEKDTYYQNGWTWVAPGATVVLSLDLSGVVLLNHVSSLGFNIGSNVGDGDYYGDNIEGQAFYVPDGGTTLMLLGAALTGLVGLRRKLV